jgi:hydroxyacylglutathione hydrolase
MPRAEFVRMMTEELPEQPAYFQRDAEINRAGAPALADLPRPRALSPDETAALAAEGHVVLDVRPAAEFGAGHVPGSLNIGLSGQFASWAGSLITLGTPVVLVAASEAQAEEAVTRLARVGHESVAGYLAGGVAAWAESGRETAALQQISVGELRQKLDEGEDLQVLDVRRAGEYAGGHAPRAISAALAPDLGARVSTLDPARPVAVICAGGYRSSAAASLLLPRGFRRLYNVTGGTGAWVAAGFPVVKP